MRPVQLARVAAEAEGIRVRGYVNRFIIRVSLVIIALAFLLGALVFAHGAIWYWLRVGLDQTFLAAAGILGGGDLLVAVVLVVSASRSTPSKVEREALDVRRKAIQGIGSSLSLIQLVLPIIRIVANMMRRTRR